MGYGIYALYEALSSTSYKTQIASFQRDEDACLCNGDLKVASPVWATLGLVKGMRLTSSHLKPVTVAFK